MPMPDPDFLRLHYEVATILDVSGIGCKMEEACWENETRIPSNLAPDGSTNLELALNAKMLTQI